MANTRYTVVSGSTYAIVDVAGGPTTVYFQSYSTNSAVALSTITTVISPATTPTITTVYSSLFVTAIPVASVGAAPTPASTPAITPAAVTTSSSTTSTSLSSTSTSSGTTSAAFGTTSASISSTTGPSNGTTTTSGSAVPAVTKVVTVPSKDTGKVAGVAVACLIGGALIAGLLTWLIMSSRQKKKSRSSGGFGSDRNRLSRSNNEKALPSAPLLGGGVAGNWERHLDQPESDNTIARSVKGLFDHIEVHVENYYRDTQVNITPDLQNALMKVEGSNDLPDSVAGLLPNAQRPTMLIKHCIAHSIIEHIDSESDISDSFLPTDFIALPQALRTRRTTSNKPAYNQAYARWRVLSAYLRPKPAEDPNYTNTRDGFIAAMADRLCRVFDPWAMSPSNFGSRRENLINIMKGGSETGVMLFSQPSTFQWVWRSSSAGAGKGGSLKVVILPGLVKVRDEEARELDRGVELLRPVVGPITG